MFQSYTSESLPRERWETLAKDSLFNQLEWLSLWDTVGARPIFFLSSPESPEETAQAFSCLRFGSGFLSRAQAGIDGLAARFFSDSNAQFQIEDEIRDEIFRTLRKSGQASATWVDYHKKMNPENLPRGWSAQWIETHHLVLTDEAPVFSGGTRREINSGHERSAEVTQIAHASQVDQCYELMQSAYRKFGRSRKYPREFYQRLFDYSSVEKRVMWYICLIDGEIIGSLIALIEGGEALNWELFIDRDRKDYKPAYLMLARLIEDASKLKLQSVNLGGSPPGAGGLVWFKERFGAKAYRYPVFVSQAPWFRLYRMFRA